MILSGQRLLDVEWAVDGQRFRTTVWRTQQRPGIGEPLTTDVAASAPTSPDWRG